MNRFLILLALVACSSSKEDSSSSSLFDSAAAGSVDSATTGTTDSAEPSGVSIPLRMTFADGFTGQGIAAAEFCTVLPVTDPACLTTDADGVIETIWNQAEYTDVLTRLTHPDYFTMLYTGRFEEDVYEGWMTALETSDAISLGYVAFTPEMVAAYLDTGSLVAEAGTGLALYRMFSADGSPLDGAVFTLEDDAGASVGQVRYQSATTTVLDSTLTATSTAGVTGIANVPPGEYTLRVAHDTLTCTPGFAFSSDVPNVTRVPIEADTQTFGSIVCFTE